MLTVAPSDPARIVVVTRGSGVFVTPDAGQTWSRSSVDTGRRRFLKILIDPFSPNNIYLYADCQLESCFDGQEASGFYRSTDGGLTFQQVLMGIEGFYTLPVLAITPSSSQIVFLAGQMEVDGEVITALMKSTDGDQTFNPTQLPAESFIGTVSVDPTNPNIVYLGGMFLTVDENGFLEFTSVMRSTEGGATFAAADVGLESQGFSPGTKELVIDPRDPMRLFALTGAGLFMSRDGAASWTHLGNDILDSDDFPLHSLSINPKKPNLLYLAGETVYEVEIK